MPKPKTPQQVKAEFRKRGITVTQWAKESGFSRLAVSQVLNGFAKGCHGNSYRIAVALGIVINNESESNIKADSALNATQE